MAAPESDFRPLWWLLLDTAVTDPSTTLTCADCLSILEYLAEADISQNYEGKLHLIQKARQYLATCPDCQSYFQRRLDEMEGELKHNKGQSKSNSAKG